MNVLTVVSHPRVDSLTFQVAHRLIAGLKAKGHQTELLDLYRSGFNPVLWEADEPEWTADNQRYSSEVEREIDRMKNHDGLAFVFPLWWWSMPAMLKGYIDRVWNYGFAYGPKKLPHQQVLWLSLAGAPIERFEKRRYHSMIDHYFNVGLADYCGIPNSKVELFYETIESGPGHVETLLNRAYHLGLNYTG
ncbi:MAG: NAD(P)H oxidoreductase [Firmicutes bacterium]|uniref:Putative NADPH-quinone reductase (Modulator of drug activity B) n=1 Tax=Melghirimyces thermohalophilus TaxID=1236220 RepID=A0A1G6LDE1_9BACL|nr:NAD(P)H oxidoreductase [Melghirimyces thermohalophilus]MDA8352953.1 NAD(P)H oxidoreductase [Bacillota bacterium]SDC41299.1 Putative NADPH-quinone reductase (modulator of drug activity B) [Melghirimyces thermohalophilus]